jgi:hypothetical protein
MGKMVKFKLAEDYGGVVVAAVKEGMETYSRQARPGDLCEIPERFYDEAMGPIVGAKKKAPEPEPKSQKVSDPEATKGVVLSSYTINELRKMAKDQDIPITGMSKADLIEALGG